MIRTRIGCIGLVLCAASALAHAGPVFVLDDKSDFAGHDFTVIDFESCCGGIPVVLDEGDSAEILGNTFADLGVLLSADDRLLIGNPLAHAEFDAVHPLVGSPRNILLNSPFPGDLSGFIRFDFTEFVNAIGFGLVHRTGDPAVRLEIYSEVDQLLGGALFEGSLIDGMYGPNNSGFGFMGLYSPQTPIAYALVHEGRTFFDDLHYGNIPEPTTALYVSLVLVLLCVARQKPFSTRRQRGFAVAVICLFSSTSMTAATDVTGIVQANIVNGPEPICGNNPPPMCDQVDLQLLPLSDVWVCITETNNCAYSGADGGFTIGHSCCESLDACIDPEEACLEE